MAQQVAALVKLSKLISKARSQGFISRAQVAQIQTLSTASRISRMVSSTRSKNDTVLAFSTTSKRGLSRSTFAIALI